MQLNIRKIFLCGHGKDVKDFGFFCKTDKKSSQLKKLFNNFCRERLSMIYKRKLVSLSGTACRCRIVIAQIQNTPWLPGDEQVFER